MYDKDTAGGKYGKKVRLLTELQSEMEQYVLPIRNLPRYKRRKNLTNKYKNNQKDSF